MKSVDQLTQQFRADGLKVTPQRQAIFRVLAEATTHPTAEAVYAAVSAEMPTISLRTVYQTLNDLAAMGEITPLDIGTGSTRFDTNLEPHHHMVCADCGRIDDIQIDTPSVAAPLGFEVATTEIVLRGRCAGCAGCAAGASTSQHPPPNTGVPARG